MNNSWNQHRFGTYQVRAPHGKTYTPAQAQAILDRALGAKKS